jgi:hypothetical protein
VKDFRAPGLDQYFLRIHDALSFLYFLTSRLLLRVIG